LKTVETFGCSLKQSAQVYAKDEHYCNGYDNNTQGVDVYAAVRLVAESLRRRQ